MKNTKARLNVVSTQTLLQMTAGEFVCDVLEGIEKENRDATVIALIDETSPVSQKPKLFVITTQSVDVIAEEIGSHGEAIIQDHFDNLKELRDAECKCDPPESFNPLASVMEMMESLSDEDIARLHKLKEKFEPTKNASGDEFTVNELDHLAGLLEEFIDGDILGMVSFSVPLLKKINEKIGAV